MNVYDQKTKYLTNVLTETKPLINGLRAEINKCKDLIEKSNEKYNSAKLIITLQNEVNNLKKKGNGKQKRKKFIF